MDGKPLRLGSLGWIEVERLRPPDVDPKNSGKCLINLDLARKIQFSEDQPGVAIVTFLDGTSEAFEDANHARLLKAIEGARLED